MLQVFNFLLLKKIIKKMSLEKSQLQVNKKQKIKPYNIK